MQKDHRKLVKRLDVQGFDCRTTRRGHVQVRLDGRVVAVLASTPSDRRSWLNAMADLKRVGYQPAH